MAVIFCDTDCELWYTRAEELGVKVINMPYIIDGEEHMCDLGEKTDFEGFFSKMKAGASASTAGLNEATYTEIFEPYFAAGEDILYIAFSSKMSATFDYLDTAIAQLQAKYPTVRYRRFDTLNISMGAGLLVYMGAKFFNENGRDIDKTYDYLESIVQKVQVLFVVDDLKYLARGGRISPGKAAIGNIMQIKPVLKIDEKGEIEIFTKQNGSKRALSYAIGEVVKNRRELDGAPIVVVNAMNPAVSDEIVSRLKEQFPSADIWTQPVGPVIGAHCGPGTYGIIFTADRR